MREDQIDQAERKAVLENDLQVLKERGSTFHQHGISQADETNQGRFRSTGTPRVIGSTPNPSAQFPAASAHQSDPCGPEPPLGFCIDELKPLSPTGVSPAAPVDDTGPASESDATPSPSAPAPLRGDVQRAADAGPSSAVAAQRKASFDKMG